MRKAVLVILGMTALMAIGGYSILMPSKPPSSQAFINGVVLTMDDKDTITESIIIEGDRIVAVGDNNDIKPFIRPDTVVHDLKGKVLMPGFIDAHGHFPGSGLGVLGVDLNSPPIGGINSIDQLLKHLKAKVATTKKGEWVFGFGYDDSLLLENRHPTREELDSVSLDHPIYVLHTSAHMGVANTRALGLAGIDKDTPDPDGGVIVRDPVTGNLTGLLEEQASLQMWKLVSNFSTWDFFEMVRSAVKTYAAVGVTTAQSGNTDKVSFLEGLDLVTTLGMVPFRLEIWPSFDALGVELLSGEIDVADYNSDRLHIGAIKVVADGSIQGYTGYLSHPYHEPPVQSENPGEYKEYRGYPTLSREALTDWVIKYHRAGYQLAIHGNGDAAIDNIIYAFDEAQKQYPREDPRLILVHAQMVRDDQLDEMKRLGITPSFFSAHTYYWGDRHWDRFMGQQRAERMSPTRTTQDKDIRFSVHLDTPVVPMDPLMLVWSTVNRVSTSGRSIGKDERISPLQALRAVTIDAAWQIFRDADLGSLEPGKLADLVVLDGNPLEHPETIKDIRVQKTIVGGVTIFSS
jgi:predicted amidohydrolase YtcJ